MFDFWVGEWDVKNAQGQPAGQSSVLRLLEGCALYENWTDMQGGGGKSLRVEEGPSTTVTPGHKVVSYQGVHLEVPASWPVVDGMHTQFSWITDHSYRLETSAAE